jgi:hypothetical protein
MLDGALSLLCDSDAEDVLSHWNISPTPLVEGVGNVSRNTAVAATF